MTIAVLFIISLLLMAMGMPIAWSLGVGAFVAVVSMGSIPLQIVSQKIYSGMDSFPLLCIPFFVFAGELMASGKLTDGLVKFSLILVGRVRGGLAMATVVASMFFGGMSGSAIADVAALGPVEIPMMVKSGYSRKFSASLVSAAAIIGPIIPPSIPMVVYAISCSTSIGALFLAGVIPGILLGLFLMAAAFIWSVKEKYPKREEKVTLKEFFVTLKEVFFALLMPLIIMGGIISGMFTPTEASAVAVGYAFVITVFVIKTLKLSDLPRLMINAGITTAIVMIIMGTATIWGWVLAMERVGDHLSGFLLQFTTPFMFLFMVNIFFLALCTFMENISAILIFAPILAPIAVKMGIHPIHFGLVFVLNTTMGLITPPLGEVLFIAAPISGLKLDELNVSIVGFFLIEVLALFVITYLPFTTLWVPRLFGLIQ